MKVPNWISLSLFVAAGACAAINGNEQSRDKASEVAKVFDKFATLVKTRSDNKNFYVESNGLPDHRMMVGITAWQQQVPLPQKYTGNNSWQFPLFPVEAKEKLSAKSHFFRGAIAIAANGIPIFNPIKNDGRTDTFLAGELDEFGGHCGRGDDYHYHIAPLVLQKQLGKSLPVAYALDGYAIYGPEEPDGSAVKGLDSFNGHSDAKLGYHYHSTKTYPYINGGFHGEVVEQDGQVDPQPRAESPRPALPPLHGAKITGFETLKAGSYSLTYSLNGSIQKVNYTINPNGSVTFNFIDGTGRSESQTYSGRGGRGGGQGGPEGQSGGRRGGGGAGTNFGNGGGDNLFVTGKLDGGQRKDAQRKNDGPQSGQKREQLGPPPGPRKPWFTDHAKEIDANKDGAVTSEEVTAECKESFKQYSQGKEFISIEELPKLPTVKLAIGGFIKVHAKELDINQDGQITEREIVDSMLRMFKKQDKNGDGKLSGVEIAG
jgi:hypothetical protein